MSISPDDTPSESKQMDLGAEEIDLSTIESVLMAQVSSGDCTWPWLVAFFRTLTSAVRTSAHFFPPHHEEDTSAAQDGALDTATLAIMDRQDAEFVGLLHRSGKAQHQKVTLNGEVLMQLGTPLSRGGEAWGGLVLWLRLAEGQSVEPFLVALQLVASFGEASIARRDGDDVTPAIDTLTGLATQLADTGSSRQAPQAFVEEAVRMTGCDVALLAFRRVRGWRVAAVQGAARLDPAGPLAGAVGAALHEVALEEDDAAIEGGKEESLAVRELARQWNCKSVRVWVLPETTTGPRAALLLGFRDAEVCDAELSAMLTTAEPGWASLLSLSRRLGSHGAMREVLGGVMRLFATGRRVIALLLIAAVTLLLFWPIPHSIRTQVRVEAVERRAVCAPYDGSLQSSLVELGDVVEAGQLLGEMDDAEILIRLAKALAARERALSRQAEALSRTRADPALGKMAQLEAEAAAIDVRLLDHRRKSLSLSAPLEGIVLREPSRMVGARVPMGQPLYEIAPPASIRLELDIPDSRIAYVREGQEVLARLESFPDRVWRARITRVHPQATVRDGANLFIVEATAEGAVPQWKPGMRGRATVQGDPQPVGWIIFHPVWEFVDWILFW